MKLVFDVYKLRSSNSYRLTLMLRKQIVPGDNFHEVVLTEKYVTNEQEMLFKVAVERKEIPFKAKGNKGWEVETDHFPDINYMLVVLTNIRVN